MSSFAELPELVGFFSYSRRDDEHSGGALSRLRARICDELRLQLGRDIRLWQDTAAIPHGTLWEAQIKTAISEAAFFIPIVTPSAVASKHCKFEFESFLERETAVMRTDLVFPILYIRVPALANEDQRRQSEVLQIVHARQYADWTKIRLQDVSSFEVGQQIARLCEDIVDALRQPWETPQQRREREAEEARRRADEEAAAAQAEQRRREQEARDKARDEELRSREEEERARIAADAKRQADEADAKRRADEAQAFASARQAGTVLALDQFLAGHPDGHFAGDAKALRTALVEREAEQAAAAAARDAAALQTSAKTDRQGSQADAAGKQLRRQAPVAGWKWLAMGVVAVCSGGLWLASLSAGRLPSLAEDDAACQSTKGDAAMAACSRIIDNSAASTKSKVLAYANRGLGYKTKGDSDRAIADYSQAIRLDSSYASAYSNRGQLYYARKDNDRAIADFNDAIRLDPRDANAYYSRGLAKRARGDTIGASSDIAAAKRLNPSVGN